MHGLVLAGICFAIYVLTCSFALKLYAKNREYRILIALLAVAVISYVILSISLPEDLGVLPPNWIELCPEVDFINGLVALVAPAPILWTYLYASGLGPSSNMMVEISRAGEKGLSSEDLYNLYRRPGNSDIIFQRRIPKLLESGYLQKLDNGYQMLPRAMKYARIASTLKRLFNTGPGG